MEIKQYIKQYNVLFNTNYQENLDDNVQLCNMATEFARINMFEEAVGMWKELIRINKIIPEVYTNLGVSLFYGNGVKKDQGKAVHYFQKAAAQGHAFGQYNFAVALEQGKGIAKNTEKAIQFYWLAAKQNVNQAIDALIRLGVYDETYLQFMSRDINNSNCFITKI